MREDEEQSQPDGRAHGGCVRDAPGQTREQEEEGEEIGEGGVGAVVGVFGLFLFGGGG